MVVPRCFQKGRGSAKRATEPAIVLKRQLNGMLAPDYIDYIHVYQLFGFRTTGKLKDDHSMYDNKLYLPVPIYVTNRF